MRVYRPEVGNWGYTVQKNTTSPYYYTLKVLGFKIPHLGASPQSEPRTRQRSTNNPIRTQSATNVDSNLGKITNALLKTT